MGREATGCILHEDGWGMDAHMAQAGCVPWALLGDRAIRSGWSDALPIRPVVGHAGSAPVLSPALVATAL